MVVFTVLFTTITVVNNACLKLHRGKRGSLIIRRTGPGCRRAIRCGNRACVCSGGGITFTFVNISDRGINGGSKLVNASNRTSASVITIISATAKGMDVVAIPQSAVISVSLCSASNGFLHARGVRIYLSCTCNSNTRSSYGGAAATLDEVLTGIPVRGCFILSLGNVTPLGSTVNKIAIRSLCSFPSRGVGGNSGMAVVNSFTRACIHGESAGAVGTSLGEATHRSRCVGTCTRRLEGTIADSFSAVSGLCGATSGCDRAGVSLDSMACLTSIILRRKMARIGRCAVSNRVGTSSRISRSIFTRCCTSDSSIVRVILGYFCRRIDWYYHLQLGFQLSILQRTHRGWVRRGKLG